MHSYLVYLTLKIIFCVVDKYAPFMIGVHLHSASYSAIPIWFSHVQHVKELLAGYWVLVHLLQLLPKAHSGVLEVGSVVEIKKMFKCENLVDFLIGANQ